MKLSRNGKMFVIGVVLLLVIFLTAGKLTDLFAVVPGQVSDGFFLYGENPTVFTNLTTRNIGDGDRNCPATNQIIDSKYWSGYGNNGGVSGGDTDFILGHGVGNTCGKGFASVTSKESFIGRDFKADIQMYVTSGGCAASGEFIAQLVDGDMPDSQCNSISCQLPSETLLISEKSAGYCNNIRYDAFSGLFELHRNVFKNTTEVLWKGQKVAEVNITGSEKIRFVAVASLGNPYQGGSTAELHITNARYRPVFSCELGPNDMLAMESFSGGQSSFINISSLRFPVQSFCLDIPAILTDSTQQGAKSTAEPYNLLINGEQVPITQTQTLTMFYVFDNTAGLVPTQCSVSQVYNTVNSTCTDLTGIVQVCSQGIQDPQTGLCVVQPSITCANGTYNSQTNKCEVVPPSGVSCSSYGSDYVYNTQTGVCERTPTSVTSCTDGRLDLETGICVFNPPVTKICTNGTYNNATDQCELKIDVSCPTGLTYDTATQSCKGQPTSPVITTQVQNQTQQGTSTTAITSTSLAYNTSYTWLSPLTMLIMLLVLSALLYLIFFTGMNGRRRWEKFKDWLWRNKEGILVGLFISNVILFIQYYGIFFIPVLGKLLELLRQSYPIAVVWFVAVALTMLAGAIVDMIIEPQK